MAKTTAQELSKRLRAVAVRVIKVADAMPRSPAARHVSGQLLRSGTSPGANYQEACAAESRRDFVHKVGIVLKELKETRYWLEICQDVPLVKPGLLGPLLKEVEELVAVFAASRTTAARNARLAKNDSMTSD